MRAKMRGPVQPGAEREVRMDRCRRELHQALDGLVLVIEPVAASERADAQLQT